MIQSRSTVTPEGTVGPRTDAWGGRSTVGGRFPETRDLDVLARDSDLTKVTNKAIDQDVKAFRTKSGSGVNVSGLVDETGQQFIARGQRGGTKVEPNIGYNASGPAPLAANPSLAAGTKMQQAAGQVRAVGGPLVAQLAGEMLAPYVQKAGEETGLIDALARGISAVVPNSILAAGNSPAEDERADEQISANLRKMGSKSGRLTGPMGIDIGKK